MPVNLFVLIAASLGFFQGQVVREGHIYLLRDFSLLISLVLIDYVKNQSRKSKATNYLKKKSKVISIQVASQAADNIRQPI